jgi:hypothetical protein
MREGTGAGSAGPRSAGARPTLELGFIACVGAVVVAAFVAALGYDFVSARAPLAIMVPLLILIAVQFNRALGAIPSKVFWADIARTARRENRRFNAAVVFIGWMALLLGLIFVVGHYVGIAAFMFFLLRRVSRETMRLSILVTAGTTMALYLLFEQVFNIELYRGLILRLLAGFS